MPDEQTPLPPPQAFAPQGVVTSKRKRWIVGGLIGASFMLLLFSFKTAAPPTTQPPRKKPLVATEPSQLAPEPSGRTAPSTLATMPQGHPGYTAGSYSGAVRPEQTGVDQVRAQRLEREEKAAFESSVITRTQQPANTHPLSATQTAVPSLPKPPSYVLPEGTVIDCSLVNELNGDFAGPVEAQVSTDVYDPKTWHLVIPQGARVLGEATKVSGFGQQRLAVVFHRILWNGHSLSLDKSPGLDQQGATALKDKVNNHWTQIFGASLAIGAIGGVAQIGNGYSGFGYSPGTAMRNGVTESMGQSSYQILDRFLQRMPTVTIRPGTRIAVYITNDIPIPDDDIQTASR